MDVLNDLLNYTNLKIYQNSNMFSFSLDSILLPNFVSLSMRDKKILDIGCGNAPIPLILSTKTKAEIIGVEIQEEVSSLAHKSVTYNNLNNQIKIINDDINNLYRKWHSDIFDVIICNPPYFKINDGSKLNKSDFKTTARHELNLNINKVVTISKKLLKNKGKLAIVNRPDRLVEIIEEMRKNNIEPKKIQFVHPKENSDCNIILVEGMKNGKPGLKILPPIYIHKENGEYSDIIKKYFE